MVFDRDAPNVKRIRLDTSEGNDASTPDEEETGDPLKDVERVEVDDALTNEEEDSCSICLHQLEDRTVIPNCSHEFCFECLVVWIGKHPFPALNR